MATQINTGVKPMDAIGTANQLFDIYCIIFVYACIHTVVYLKEQNNLCDL